MKLASHLTCAALLFSGLHAALAQKLDSTSLKLGSVPLLFADDSGISSRDGLVRTVHAARTRAEPVLEPEKPWEGGRVYVYGSVYRDEQGGYRMWYNHGRSVSYATSSDGVHWSRPSLGLHAFDGSKDNNIVFNLHSPAVLIDRFERDPAKRYKMIGSARQGYRVAYSSDGLNWTEYPNNPVLAHSDTITLTQHPQTGEYFAYHKRPARVRGFGRRVVWLSRSLDFQNWSEPELVFTADEMDDTWVTQSHERTEVYNMSVYPHAAGFIGLPAIFRVMKMTPPDQVGPAQSPADGPIDIQLATSADGREWHRSWPRINIIPRGAPGSFDGGTILGVSSVPVHTDKETWVYYTAINTGHGGPMPPKRITIGRAEWRRHGFVSLDAGPEGGRLQTVPLQLAGQLIVNADAARGQLRVTLLEADGRPVPGFAFEDCHPLTRDETAGPVTWRGGSVPTDRPVRVVMEMKNVRLYSLAAEAK